MRPPARAPRPASNVRRSRVVRALGRSRWRSTLRAACDKCSGTGFAPGVTSKAAVLGHVVCGASWFTIVFCALCVLLCARRDAEKGVRRALAVAPGHGARRSRPRRPRFDSGWRAQPAAPLDHVGRSSQVLLAQPCLAEGARPSAAPLSPTHPPASPQRTHSRTRIPTAHARDRRRRR